MSGVLGLPGEGETPRAKFGTEGAKLVLLDHAFWKTVGGGALPTPRAGKREGVVLAVEVAGVDGENLHIRSKGVAIASPAADRPMTWG